MKSPQNNLSVRECECLLIQIFGILMQIHSSLKAMKPPTSKRITQKNIALTVGMSESYLSKILKDQKRPKLQLAKRLAAAVPGSTPEHWIEAPPETLRQIILEYSYQQNMPPLAGRAPAHEHGLSAMPCTENP